MAKDKKSAEKKPDTLPAKGGEAEPGAKGGAPAKAAKPGSRQTVMIVAGFLLSAAVVNTMMFFYFRKVRLPVTAPLAEVRQEMARDTVAAVDSLLQDSLVMVVDELVDHVIERSQEVAELKDSTTVLHSEVDKLRAELQAVPETKVELKDEDLDRLSRVFGSMQPAKAAPVMLKMDNAAVAGILLSIKERTAAKILAAMPPEKAAEIARLIRDRAADKQKQARERRK